MNYHSSLAFNIGVANIFTRLPLELKHHISVNWSGWKLGCYRERILSGE